MYVNMYSEQKSLKIRLMKCDEFIQSVSHDAAKPELNGQAQKSVTRL